MSEDLSVVLREEQGNPSAIRVMSAVVASAAQAANAANLPATTRLGAVVVKETMSVVLAVLEGRLDPDELGLEMPDESGTRGLERSFLSPEVTQTIVKESLTLLVKVIQGGLKPENINLSEKFVTSTTDKLADMGITEADIERILQGS